MMARTMMMEMMAMHMCSMCLSCRAHRRVQSSR